MVFLTAFAREEAGASLIEYTVLLGIITGAVLMTAVAIGAWINGVWTALPP